MAARCLSGCDRGPAAWHTLSQEEVHTSPLRWNELHGCQLSAFGYRQERNIPAESREPKAESEIKMGQKINPVSFRTGIMIGWKSRWYASKKEYASLLIEDHKIRKYVTEKYKFAGIPKIEIERTRDEVKVVLHAARPGVIIGRKGQQVDQLQD